MSYLRQGHFHYTYYDTPEGRALWPVTPDPNPMPYVAVSDRLDRLIAYWHEARWAGRVAYAVLRHGYDYEAHLGCGDRR